jgi:alkylation response protein AidB-like acyl-CoA dehydrogenase
MTDQATVDVAFDEADLAALRDSIVSVLVDECDSLKVHAFIDGKNQLDQTLWRQAAELGWLAVALPEEFGGLNMGVRGLDVLHAELGRHMAPGPFIGTLSAAHALAVAGDEATKQAWLPRVAAGEVSLAVPAVLVGSADGRTALLGSPDASATLLPGEGGGWSLVELPAGAATPIAMWDRTRAVIEVDTTQLPAGTPLGKEAGNALILAMALAVAADSLGGAERISSQTIEYLKTRQQFGRVLASFQALKHRSADLAVLGALGEQTVANGVDAVANGDPDALIWAMMAKSEVVDGYIFTAADCVQLHGGVGFTWEFDPHIHLKRARLNEMLVANNPAARDIAAERLAVATRAGRTTLELPSV